MVLEDNELPDVLFHVLAKDKEKILPYWLKQNLDKLDYPRNKVHIYIRTNNNNDKTATILQQWVYAQNELFHEEQENTINGEPWKYDWLDIELDDSDVPEPVQNFGVHEWNAMRFDVLGALRQDGIEKAKELGYHYFVADVDNFLLPETLRTLVSASRPVIAPLLRYAAAEGEENHVAYSNYHHPVTETGYYRDSDEYFSLLNGIIRGIFPIDLVHCTYLIHPKALPFTNYFDGTQDYEYVRVSRNWRKNDILQYLDNRKIYGYLTLHENLEAIKHWMGTLK